MIELENSKTELKDTSSVLLESLRKSHEAELHEKYSLGEISKEDMEYFTSIVNDLVISF